MIKQKNKYIEIAMKFSNAIDQIAIDEKLNVSEVVPLVIAILADQCVDLRGKEKAKEYLQEELDACFILLDEIESN